MNFGVYKIAIKFDRSVSKKELLEILLKFFFISNHAIYDNFLEAEIKTKNGWIEISTIDTFGENISVKTYINISLALVEGIVDDIMTFLKQLNLLISITGILDIQYGVLIDLNNYQDFKSRYKIKCDLLKAKYPDISYPMKYKNLEAYISLKD